MKEDRLKKTAPDAGDSATESNAAPKQPKLSDIAARFMRVRDDGMKMYKIMTPKHGIVEVPENQISASELAGHKRLVEVLYLHEVIQYHEARYVEKVNEYFPDKCSVNSLDNEYTLRVTESSGLELKNEAQIRDHFEQYLSRFEEANVPEDQQAIFATVKEMFTSKLKPGRALDTFLRFAPHGSGADDHLVAARKLLTEGKVVKPAVRYVNIFRNEGGNSICIRKNVKISK